MSYPDYPNNRLIVNGVDLSEEFKMVLSDGYTLEPPSIKTYTVDIPGGNGKLDLTESLIGDTNYDNRNQEFTFYLINVEDFEKAKTLVSNFLHGKAFDYKLTFDPEYTYHGRFTVSSYSHGSFNSGKVGVITIKSDADPFKYKEDSKYLIDAVGGITVELPSGRMRVCPTITVEGLTKIIYKGILIVLKQGTWIINDINFHEGNNEVYINSYDIHNFTWGDLRTKSITWGQFKEKRLYEWYKSNNDGTYETKTWDEVKDFTWGDLSIIRWCDLIVFKDIPDDIKEVLIQYKWGDL